MRARNKKKRALYTIICILIDLVLAAGLVLGYYYFGILYKNHSLSGEDVIVIKREDTSDDNTEKEKNIEYLTWTSKYIDKFSETVIKTDNFYSDQHVCVSITPCTKGEGEDKISYYVADIYVASIEYFRTNMFNYDTTFRSYVTSMRMWGYDRSNILIVNGDYAGATSNGLIIRNGEVYRNSKCTSDLCVLLGDGQIKIYPENTYKVDQAIADGAWQAWMFGPSLLRDDGSAKTDISEYTLTSTSYYNTMTYLSEEHPRTVLGYYEPGHYAFVVVDGREENYSSGATLQELSQICEELGFTSAYNMDGGGSTTMSWYGKSVNHSTTRGITDFIVVDIDPPKSR